MSIQQNINQMLSVAGIMAKMSPKLAAEAERNIKLQDLAKQEEVATKALEMSGTMTEEETEATKMLSDIASKRFKLDPSEATLAGKQGAEEAVINPSLYDPKFEGRAEEREILTKGLEEQAARQREAEKAQRALVDQQERTRNTRRALGLSDLEAPKYSVRPETEPSGHQTSFPLKTSEREPMYPKKGVK